MHHLIAKDGPVTMLKCPDEFDTKFAFPRLDVVQTYDSVISFVTFPMAIVFP